MMYLFAVLGTLLAIRIITNADTRVATALLGLTLVSYAIVGLSGWRLVIRGKSEFWLGQVVGLVSGILNGATGVFVIPSAPYLQAVHRDKDEFVQAIAVSAFVFAVALALGLGLNSALDPGILVSGCRPLCRDWRHDNRTGLAREACVGGVSELGFCRFARTRRDDGGSRIFVKSIVTGCSLRLARPSTKCSIENQLQQNASPPALLPAPPPLYRTAPADRARTARCVIERAKYQFRFSRRGKRKGTKKQDQGGE